MTLHQPGPSIVLIVAMPSTGPRAVLYMAHERVEPVPSVILTSLISVQLPARTHPATSKGSALRPSGTTPAPATPGSMGQSVNTVRLALGWCCFGS